MVYRRAAPFDPSRHRRRRYSTWNPPSPPRSVVLLPHGYGTQVLHGEGVNSSRRSPLSVPHAIGQTCRQHSIPPIECVHTHCTLGRDPCFPRRQTVRKYPTVEIGSTLQHNITRPCHLASTEATGGYWLGWWLGHKLGPTPVLAESTTLKHRFLAREFDVTNMYRKQLGAQS